MQFYSEVKRKLKTNGENKVKSFVIVKYGKKWIK
jgi:hypothetical protein